MTESELEFKEHVGPELPLLCEKLGLSYTKTTLKKYPGSTHSHLSKPGSKGVMELTVWPTKRRFWLSIHDNRRAEWQAEVIEAIAETFKP